MQVQEATKKTVIVFVMLCVAVLLSRIEAKQLGLYAGCPWWHRISYQFAHANIIHLAMNAYCLWLCVTRFRLSLLTIGVCFLVACTAPSFSAVPTIGVSGLVYALFGYINNLVLRKWYFAMWIALYIAVTAFFATNALLHLYCYIGGLTIGYITIVWKRYRRY